jgi:hypothetical protein
VTIEIGREPFVATYMVEGDDPLLCEAASRCAAGTMLTVFGPPAPLRAPSDRNARLGTGTAAPQPCPAGAWAGS